MSEYLNPIFLSRIQFAFVISFHIIFPALTIGLASWLMVLEGLWLKTKHPAKLDVTVQQIHNAVFENIDCLTCANCCKTTSPIFYKKDIK